jgi:hypothetical protein
MLRVVIVRRLLVVGRRGSFFGFVHIERGGHVFVWLWGRNALEIWDVED